MIVSVQLVGAVPDELPPQVPTISGLISGHEEALLVMTPETLQSNAALNL